MSRPFAGTGDRSRGGKALAAPLLVLAALLWATVTPAGAQDNAPVRPRARTLLQTAREYYGRGEYETAAFYYAKVKENEKELTPTEQTDFRNQVLLNNEALRKRREGAEQIHKAEEAWRQGRAAEAGALLKSAGLNQYLGVKERRELAQLTTQVRNGPPVADSKSTQKARALLKEGRALLARGDYLGATTKAHDAERLNPVYMAGEDTHIQLYMDIDRVRKGQPAQFSSKPPADRSALLTAARAALQRGELDTAEDLAHQAEKAKTGMFPIQAPWADSPSKVLRDVSAARAKQAAPPPPATSSSPSPFRGVKGLFTRGNSGTDVKPATPVPEGPVLNPPPLPGPTGPTSQAPTSPYAVAQGVTTPMPPQTGTKDDRTAAARQLVREGYIALHNNDVARARQCAEDAKNLHVALNWWEDTPDKLLADIGRHSGTLAQDKGKSNTPIGDGHALVREGRTLLRDGKLDDAEKVCTLAFSAKTSWGLFEDSPDKLRHDIQQARSRQEREESVKLLAEARKQFAQGQLQEAKTLAWRAQQLHGPYSIWDLGDRPSKLLAEVDRAESERRGKGKTPTTMVADAKMPASPSGVKPAPAPAPINDMLAKQQALALLSEARALQHRGQLIEARQKALEAQRTAGEGARSLFGPGEDRPETVLLQLGALCDLRINNLLQHASDCVTASNDPGRFKRAQTDLSQARQLAQGFGQDTVRIEQKMAWLQQTQTTTMLAQGPPPAPLPDLGPPPSPIMQVSAQTPSKGKQLLEQARLELKSGQTAMARRLAVAAYEPSLGVQDEATALLRSIDAEEYNQARLAASRSADAAIDAYQHQDYRQAANIAGSINQDFLDPEKRMRLKEIAGMREMQPTAVAAAPGGPIRLTGAEIKAPEPGTAHISDIPSPPSPLSAPSPGGSGDSFERLHALEQIQLQQLREESLRAQRDANDRARTGDFVGAMDILRDFDNRLADSHLDSEKVKVLRRQIEGRLSHLAVMKAQHDFQAEQTAGLSNAGGREHQREIEKSKHDAEISALLKQVNTLTHEAKYTEALTLAEKAHTLDPDNVAVNQAVFMVQQMKNIARGDEIKAAKNRMFMDQLDDHPGPSLTMNRPLALTNDKAHEAVIQKRYDFGKGIQAPTHDPIEQSIERKLMTPISPVNFKDVPLRQAIDDLGTLGGLKIFIDKQAMNDGGINLEQPISFSSQEGIFLKSALNLLLGQAKLTYVTQDQTLQVTTADKAKGQTKMVTYPVADLVVPPTDGTLANSSSFEKALERQGNAQGVVNSGPTPVIGPTSLAGGMPVGSPGGSLANGTYRNLAPGQASVLPPGRTIEDTLINVITSMIAPESWSDVGGKGNIKYYPLGMALVVNQTQDIQEQVADLLAALRRLQELEVAIEMKMITVSEAFYEMIGVNFDINIQQNNARFGPQLVTQNFQLPGQINNFSPNGFVSGLTPQGTLTPDLSIPITNSSFQFSQPPFGGFPGTLGMDGGLSMGLAFLSEIQVFMFMEAAQVDRRTNVMQAPKITVFNGQTANITVQDQQFFLTGVQLVQAGAQVFFVPNQQPFPLGVQLQVTPVVSADRRFVRVNLQPTLTNLASTNVPLIPVQIPVPQLFEGPGATTTSGGQPVIFQMFFQQPTFTQISLNTTVSVPDGGTVLLGGLKTLSEGRTEAGPPILSKIPYISRLFKNTAYGRDSQSLLIMVTPRIIINEEEEHILLGDPGYAPIPRQPE